MLAVGTSVAIIDFDVIHEASRSNAAVAWMSSFCIGERRMLIGIVSDTHGHLGNTREAVQELDRQNVDAVLHCGDIGSVDVIPFFDPWPTHFVFGNVDHNQAPLRESIELAGQTCHGRFGSLELEGRHIALLHSDDASRFHDTVSGEQFDLVCYGHTHVAQQQMVGNTLVLNPGAIYRANPHSIAVVELSELKVTFIELGS